MSRLFYSTSLIVLLCVSCMLCYSQTINSCTGITITGSAGATYNFTNYDSQMAGATTEDAVNIQYNPNDATCSGWSLRVSATGDFTNGAHFIGLQYFSLRFNRVSQGSPSAGEIGASNTAYPLNTMEVALIRNSNASFSDFAEHQFDMLIQGGNHLLVPSGIYSSNLIFTLYDQNNQAVSMLNLPVMVQVETTPSNGFMPLLQNGADMVNIVFNTTADFHTEKSVFIASGLKIQGNAAYQVVVKTDKAYLSSNATSATIPVNMLSVEATKSTATNASITTFMRQLSTAEQVLITSPSPLDDSQQEIEYDLRYYLTPHVPELMQPAGTYNVDVIFIVTAR